MTSVNHVEPALPNILTQSPCGWIGTDARCLFVIRHPDVLMEISRRKDQKIFVEKGEVEQM
jgi:hypothetical protein